MIALIDYGLGNLFSVERALKAVKAGYVVTSNPNTLEKASKLILPGVGAFGDGMKGLRQRKLVKPIKRLAQEKPLLGICLGMQLLMEIGNEFGKHKGLGLVKGEVEKMNAKEKLPQIGWNKIKKKKESKILKMIKNGEYFYFVHSYVVRPTTKEVVAATTDYGEEFCSVIEYNNIYGTQFHPEKSGENGLKIYDNFVNQIS